MTEWTLEELDEFQSTLWALLTFMEIKKQDILEAQTHAESMLKQVNRMIDEHGGRFYKGHLVVIK